MTAARRSEDGGRIRQSQAPISGLIGLGPAPSAALAAAADDAGDREYRRSSLFARLPRGTGCFARHIRGPWPRPGLAFVEKALHGAAEIAFFASRSRLARLAWRLLNFRQEATNARRSLFFVLGRIENGNMMISLHKQEIATVGDSDRCAAGIVAGWHRPRPAARSIGY
jgi:hypothetical protein